MGLRKAAESLVQALGLALIFGLFTAITLNAYILINYFSLTSNRLLALVLLAAPVGSIVFYFVFRWLRPKLAGLAPLVLLFLVCLSLLLSIFLFYTTSDGWSDEHRYPSVLLPNHTLKIQAIDSQENLTIQWLNTSAQEISYDSTHLKGWQRKGNNLVLVDPKDNSIEWQGKIGNQLSIVFQRPQQETTVLIGINGAEDRLTLQNTGPDEITILREVPVPFFASRMAAQVSLWLACAGLFFAGLVFLAVGEKQFAQRLHGFIVQTIPESMDGLSGGTARFQKWEWLVLGATILAALLLRSFHLDNLYPYADEYSHLNAAKQILNGTSIFTAYQRGMYMVTLPVVLAFKMFGSQVWAARVPGVLVNSLALLPLYLLSRKINRSTAILAIFLYATNPWIITVARSIREYGYIPFYSFWILYGMLLVLENMPRRIVLDRRILTQIHKNWVVPLILLILPVMYIFKIDSFSTFKVFLMAYGIFALFVLARVDMKARENFLPLAGILVLLGLGGFVYISNLGFVSFKLVLFTAPLRLFFPNPEQQWYHDRLNFLPLLAFFFAVVAAVWQVRRNPAPLFLVVQFGTFLTFFLLFFSRYYRPKYLFSVEILLIPVLAFGFSILWLILKTSVPRKGIQIGAACLALLATINPAQSILPSRFDLNGLMPISQEYHYDVSVVDEYMRQNAKPSDALVSTIYRSYVSFKGEPVFLAKSGFQQDNPGEIEVLAQFMQKYPSGWLVLDLHRYRSWTQQLPQTQFELKGIPVKYMGEYHEQYVWKWGE